MSQCLSADDKGMNMIENVTELLDTEELLHLALAARQEGKSEAAITFLKRGLALAPNDGRLHYLLGAEHAQLGLYSRAMEEMQRAVDLNPDLDTAHFQLGLLYVTSGNVDLATEKWKALDKLGHDHFLYLFKTGLLHLTNNELTECAEFLNRGIAANTANDALNNDMRRVLKDVETHMAANPAETSTPSSPATKTDKKHVLLNAYQKNRVETKDN